MRKGRRRRKRRRSKEQECYDMTICEALGNNQESKILAIGDDMCEQGKLAIEDGRPDLMEDTAYPSEDPSKGVNVNGNAGSTQVVNGDGDNGSTKVVNGKDDVVCKLNLVIIHHEY